MIVRTLITLFLLVAVNCLHANIEVLARFEPSRIAIGNTSKYIVEIIESSADTMPVIERINSMPIPQVNGLALRNGHTSTSQQTNIINGSAEYSITQKLIIDAIPSSTGNYTLPSYNFEYKGNHLQIPAVTLNVVESSEDAAPTITEMIFLDLEAPEQLYLGQSILVNLKLHAKDGVQLRGLNSYERDADGFTITGGPPEEAIENIEIVNGRRYKTYSWPLKITPIRAGKQALNFGLGVTGQLPSQQNTNRYNSPFGNSIFDDFFGRAERLNLYSKPTEINVLALPLEGQPESFSGAIGQFNLKVSADSESTRVGEPIMLSLKLSGKGNFDRIQGPKLPEAQNWRSYPPESVFESDESQPLEGTKRFDYVFIPEKTGTLELPEVSFSFFDPEVKKYVESTIPAITIEVAPSERPVIPVPTPENTMATTTPGSSVNPVKSISPEDLLLTLDYRPKSGRNLSEKLITPGAFFYWINGSLFIAFCISIILTYRRRRLLNDPKHKLVFDAKKELKAALKETQSDDPTTFFRCVQKIVRLAATVHSKQDLLTADISTLETEFHRMGLAETVIDQTRVLFQIAEAHRFSGKSPAVDLSHYRNQLKTVLNAL